MYRPFQKCFSNSTFARKILYIHKYYITGGHDKTAIGIACTILMLAYHQDVQDKEVIKHTVYVLSIYI